MLFFSCGVPNLATVIPAIDLINKALTTLSGSSSRFSLAICAALTIGKRTLDKYHNKTRESDVYCIAMGVFLPPQLDVCHTLLTSTHQYIVLHPCYKLEYFKRNKWDAKSIKAAHDLVQDEFNRSYWLLDIEGDDRMTHADGNISVSDHLLTPELFSYNSIYRLPHLPNQQICSTAWWILHLPHQQMTSSNITLQQMLRMWRTDSSGGMRDVPCFHSYPRWPVTTFLSLVSLSFFVFTLGAETCIP